MLKNVQLSLMIGPVVPLPVPREVVEALESVEVTPREMVENKDIVFALLEKAG